MAVTRKEIEQGLIDLGLSSGDIVMVHSSLSSFGYVEGGADAVVDAILSVIGPDGTMVVPTFNYSPEAFDPNTTPSLTGSITEAVRIRPEARRSLHPTHSVAAIGRDAEEITEGHENVDAFGVGSPLHKILEKNGKILQIGVNHKSNSMIHVAEELAKVPYIERSTVVNVALPNGQTERITIRRPGCSRGFNKITDDLEESGEIRETYIGESLLRLMPASAVVSAAVGMLAEDPGSLLCDIGDCSVCAEARAVISATTAEEEEKDLIQFFKEIETYIDPETGEEYELTDLDVTPEEGFKNGEIGPD